MKTRPSRTKRLAGVYLRGKIFWYRYSFDGRTEVQLDDAARNEAYLRQSAGIARRIHLQNCQVAHHLTAPLSRTDEMEDAEQVSMIRINLALVAG